MADYSMTIEQIPILAMIERILVFMYHLDRSRGRTGEIATLSDLRKEELFQYSVTFAHSKELVFYQIVKWSELDDTSSDAEHGFPTAELPPGCIGSARIPSKTRRSYSASIRRLVRSGLVNALTDFMRAMQGDFLGKMLPQLSLWEPKSGYNEICAISLSTNGFHAAQEIATKTNVPFPWQIHHMMIEDPKFADFILGSQKPRD